MGKKGGKGKKVLNRAWITDRLKHVNKSCFGKFYVFRDIMHFVQIHHFDICWIEARKEKCLIFSLFGVNIDFFCGTPGDKNMPVVILRVYLNLWMFQEIDLHSITWEKIKLISFIHMFEGFSCTCLHAHSFWPSQPWYGKF